MNQIEREMRLTAYALGELPESEMREVEAEIAADAEAERMVEEVRETSRLLRQEFAAEASDSLTPPQREAITSEVSPARELLLRHATADAARSRAGRRRVIGLALSAAACVAVVASLKVWTAAQNREADRLKSLPHDLAIATPLPSETTAPQSPSTKPFVIRSDSVISFYSPKIDNSDADASADVNDSTEMQYRGDAKHRVGISAGGGEGGAGSGVGKGMGMGWGGGSGSGSPAKVASKSADPAAYGPAPAARIASIEGKVQYRESDNQPWKTAQAGVELPPGAELRSMPRSTTKLTTADGKTVTLDRLGTVKLEEAIRGSESVKTKLGMKYGRTRYDVERDGVEHQASVSTPSTTLAIRGTEVNVTDDDQFSAEARSLTGRARFNSRSGKPDNKPTADQTHQPSVDERGFFFRLPDQQEAEANRDRAEAYSPITDNGFLDALGTQLSTFSIDVDTASYSNTRRFLTSGQLPPADAVRIEELVNYFDYTYSGPADDKPFEANIEVNAAPWAPTHRLVRIGLKGKEVAQQDRPAANLVFLLDVSGSMQPANKLPLVREAMKLLVNELRDDDRVAIAVYAGSEGLVLDSTPAKERRTILDAIDRLSAGGSTNGGAGITLAYKIAGEHFIDANKNGVAGINRVILCTDGDFNVGVTNQNELVRLIADKAKTGVYLTVLGFGMGNLKDSTLEKLADKGNGNYGYIDTLNEAKKVLIRQMNGTLVTIAKDVKIQVEFNPAKVASYRLIGYENRLLAKEDFNDDTKDAGEIGAGHTVTALYEVVPTGQAAAEGARAAGLDMDATIRDLERQISQIKATMAVTKLSPEGQAQMQKEIERLQGILDPLKARKAAPPVDPLKYQKVAPAPAPALGMVASDELLTLKLRYKAPDAPEGQGTSKLIEFPVKDTDRPLAHATDDYRFAAAVAEFGMLLRGSPHKGDGSYAAVLDLAQGSLGEDRSGYRHEFVKLVEKARQLAGQQ